MMPIATSLNSECIAALASPPGPAERGIVRLSGTSALITLRRLLVDSTLDFHPVQPRCYSAEIAVAEGTCRLPVLLAVWPTSRSFTGEPLVELHMIGSPPLLNEVLELLFRNGARPAERGEFTLRAFLAGRIDLVQAEAVLGVIDAANTSQLQTALDQLAGGISNQIAQLREDLLLHLADLEAGLDFVEEDIDFVQRPVLLSRLEVATEQLQQILQQSQHRMQSTGSYRVVLAGLPNAGKSTLFNALSRSPMALVSPIAGTTRDYLATELRTPGGLRFELIDTAGWETPRDGIEAAASLLRDDQYDRADLILWCRSVETLPNAPQQLEDVQQVEIQQLSTRLKKPLLTIRTKVDLATGDVSTFDAPHSQVIDVSAQSGTGLATLMLAIEATLSEQAEGAELIGSTAARCQESLEQALQSIATTRELVLTGGGDELIALELRGVLDHLGRIVGAVYTDDILDRIFSRFCIGK